MVNYDVNCQVMLYLMAVLFYEELQQADFQQRLVLLLWATFVEAGKQTSHEHFNHQIQGAVVENVVFEGTTESTRKTVQA